MCFSATASFIAGVSLSVLGVATVKKAKRKAEIPFAMIPRGLSGAEDEFTLALQLRICAA